MRRQTGRQGSGSARRPHEVAWRHVSVRCRVHLRCFVVPPGTECLLPITCWHLWLAACHLRCLSPLSFVGSSQSHMISMRCRTFNATAGGYMRGDGCSGMSLGALKRSERSPCSGGTRKDSRCEMHRRLPQRTWKTTVSRNVGKPAVCGRGTPTPRLSQPTPRRPHGHLRTQQPLMCDTIAQLEDSEAWRFARRAGCHLARIHGGPEWEICDADGTQWYCSRGPADHM